MHLGGRPVDLKFPGRSQCPERSRSVGVDRNFILNSGSFTDFGCRRDPLNRDVMGD